MNRFLPCLTVPALFLSACGSQEATPEPGEYQQSVKITELDFPGIEGDAKTKMIEQMEAVGNGPANKFCMSAEQGDNQWKEAASQMAGALGGSCETVRDEGSANSLDLEMQCKGTARGDIIVTMTGSARKDGYDSEMSFDMNDPSSDESAKLALEIGAERVGDCAG